MKTWKVPVIWEACGIVEVEANTMAEALVIAKDDDGVIPLPKESEYVDGSWDLSDDNAEEIRYSYNDNQPDELPMFEGGKDV